MRELTRYIAFSGRYNTPAALIYFDMNHLKKINDNFGHAAGDTALRHFAETLLSHVRDSDCVGRLGGDEFGVLLTHADQEQALKKADVLADALRGGRVTRSHESPWMQGFRALPRCHHCLLGRVTRLGSSE